MKITIWGSRGSLPSPSPENNRFGGNTSCVQVCQDDAFVVLDAGSGIRRLGSVVPPGTRRIDILLTHLHMDHIMGLGFFHPLYNPEVEVNIWGPACNRESLMARLHRYLSPPLFPIRLRDLPSQPNVMEISQSVINIGPLKISSSYICHPGPTVGFRIENGRSALCYLPDHEPALGGSNFPNEPAWTSGYDLAHNADLLMHDAQYTEQEYLTRVGWGHSSVKDALKFAELATVKKMLLFHHDPSRTDAQLNAMLSAILAQQTGALPLAIAGEGDYFELGI